MMHVHRSLCSYAFSFSLFAGLASIAAGTSAAYAESLPGSTAIPVVFTHSVKAGKVSAGAVVQAKTMQVVVLPGGQTIPAGTIVSGHVVASRQFSFDNADYAVQKPSSLSIHFDKLAMNGQEIPLNVSVRALSNDVESSEAETPHYLDETDSVGTRVLVGGDEFSLLAKQVVSRDGDTVGYSRRQGVFARLMPNTSGSLHCEGSGTEQSVAIFSASACGIYGYGSVSLRENGTADHGTFTLESRRQTVELHAQSTALLQVIGS